MTISGGAITAVNSITVPGSYSVFPTDITQEPVTGASLTGAKLALTMGLAGGTVAAAGKGYLTAPAGTVTGGAGSGASFTTTLKVVSVDQILSPGAGYAPSDTATLAGGTSTTAAIMSVTNTKLVALAVNAGGSGYVVGDTLTLTGGTQSTAAQLTVAAVSSGAITQVAISNPGVFTANAATFTQNTTSGSGTGATFNGASYGVNAASISNAGSYSVAPSGAIAQASSSGSGTGLLISAEFGVNTITLGAAGTGYTSLPILNLLTAPNVGGSGADTTEDTLLSLLLSPRLNAGGGTAVPIFRNPGDTVQVEAFGTLGANGNTKTVKLYVGGASITSGAQTGNAVAWWLQAEIVMIAQNLFSVLFTGQVGSTALANVVSYVSVPTIGELLIKITGTNGTAQANDVVANALLVTEAA